MAELEFEHRLERLFDDAPAFADDEAFAQRVAQRLDRGWAARRVLIGLAGVAGGLIGGAQLVMSNVAQRVEGAGDSARVIEARLTQIVPSAEWLGVMPASAEVIWVTAGLALLAVGFAITRVIEEV